MFNFWKLVEGLGAAEIEREHIERDAFRAMVQDVIAGYAWRRAAHGG